MARAPAGQRVRVDELHDELDRRSAVYEATSLGLRRTAKELPSLWLYDERGSQLYDEIVRLPDYYLPRREHEILQTRAAEIANRTKARTLVELGAGTAKNVRVLLDAFAADDTLELFVPLDLSEGALRANAEAIAAAYPWVSVHALVGDFERDQGLLPGGGRRLIAFLGSTIGNLDDERRAWFLTKLSETLVPDDALLLGLDLVKDPARLHAAYNDEGGVTEAFVRNALTAANRELRATFDQERFAYEARWDPEREWMEIGLRAREPHTVELPRLDLEIAFDADEFLRVEVSAKFRRERVELEVSRARLRIDEWWTDPEGDFALALAVP